MVTGCLSGSVTPWMIHSRAASLNPTPVDGSADGHVSVDIFCSVGRVKSEYTTAVSRE